MRRLIKYREDDQLSFYKKHIKKLILSLIILTSSTVLLSCLDGIGGLPNSITADPFNLQIIVPNLNNDAIFGNLCDITELEVKVLEELTPNGSTVQYDLNSISLPVALRGNLISVDFTIVDGISFADYLAGLLIGAGNTATVNIHITITTPAGDSQSDNVNVTLLGVDIIAPEGPTEIEANPPPEFCTDMGLEPQPFGIFVTLTFSFVGIPPTSNTGSLIKPQLTVVTTDPTVGTVFPSMPAIVGTVNSAQAVVTYSLVDGGSGTNIVRATLILPDPRDKFFFLPSIPVEDRTLTAELVITQSVGMDCFDGVTIEPTIDSFGFDPSPIVEEESSILTTQTSNYEGRQVCFEVTDDGGTGCIPVDQCSPADFSGIATGGVTCPASGNAFYISCLDLNTNFVCDPGEPFLNGTLTVVPAEAAAILSFSADPNPLVLADGDSSSLNTQTQNFSGGTVCFNITDAGVTGCLIDGGLTDCSAVDVSGLATSSVTCTTEGAAQLRSCLDSDSDMSCTGETEFLNLSLTVNDM